MTKCVFEWHGEYLWVWSGAGVVAILNSDEVRELRRFITE